jgi:uncharacterized protein YpiB (UPF0302 family)
MFEKRARREKTEGVIEELIIETVKEVAEQKERELAQKEQQLELIESQWDQLVQNEIEKTTEEMAVRIIDAGFSLQDASKFTGLSIQKLNEFDENRIDFQ